MSSLSEFGSEKLSDKEAEMVAKVLIFMEDNFADDDNDLRGIGITQLDNMIYNAQKIKEAIEKGVK